MIIEKGMNLIKANHYCPFFSFHKVWIYGIKAKSTAHDGCPRSSKVTKNGAWETEGQAILILVQFQLFVPIVTVNDLNN